MHQRSEMKEKEQREKRGEGGRRIIFFLQNCLFAFETLSCGGVNPAGNERCNQKWKLNYQLIVFIWWRRKAAVFAN